MSSGASTEEKLNIPQLTLAKLAESMRHESVHTRGPRVLGSHVQFPLDCTFFYWNYFALHCVSNRKKTTLLTLRITEKLGCVILVSLNLIFKICQISQQIFSFVGIEFTIAHFEVWWLTTNFIHWHALLVLSNWPKWDRQFWTVLSR